jgi:hypothetical protein
MRTALRPHPQSPAAAKQREVAAVNAIGGQARLTAEVPAAILKWLRGTGRAAAQAGA